jgi:hypothetical protein
MPLHTSILVDCPMPDGEAGGWFTTPDLSEALEDLHLCADGRLMRSSSEVAHLLEEDGQPRTLAELAYFLTRSRSEQKAEEPVMYTGFLALRDAERRYTARLEDGMLTGMRSGGLDSWFPHSGDPVEALQGLSLAFSQGRTPAAEDVRRYLDKALAVQS